MSRTLSGIRVLDLTAALSGPYTAMMLGDLGAEVIKIEPLEGEPFRLMGPHFKNDWSVYFVGCNRNKMGLALNLKLAAGLDIFYRLAEQADVVLDNFRPGVLARLKIDHETLSALNPRIITCSITGYGSEGTYRDRTAFDLCVQAASGMLSITGTEDGHLCKVGAPIGDLAAGQNAAIGILGALFERERSGLGQHIDISMFDSQLSLLCYQVSWYATSGIVPKPLGTGHLGIEPHGTYAAADGQLVLMIGTEKFWLELCDALGMAELKADPRFNPIGNRHANRQELRRIIEEVLATKTVAEWIEILVEAGIPAAPVNTLDKALQSPPTRERNMLVQVEQPGWGGAHVVGNPVKFSRTPCEEFAPAPGIGEHTRDILHALLGYSGAEIDRLAGDGVIGTSGAPK